VIREGRTEFVVTMFLLDFNEPLSTAAKALRDFETLEALAAPNSIIAIHDVVPMTWMLERQRRKVSPQAGIKGKRQSVLSFGGKLAYSADGAAFT
jgi:hypothetical protein